VVKNYALGQTIFFKLSLKILKHKNLTLPKICYSPF